MDERRPDGDTSTASVGTNRALEHLVHWTLLLGLALSALLLSAGLLWTLVQNQVSSRTTAEPLPSPGAALRGAAHGDMATILLDLGLLALMATPVTRVAVLGIGWAWARDWRFAAIALTVLALLGLSLALGLG
jgi:uncharacterized membrane protein